MGPHNPGEILDRGGRREVVPRRKHRSYDSIVQMGN
jgi:hypothetical protein